VTSHEWIDRRSLALDKAIAQKLQQEPQLLQRAKDTLQRWIHQREPEIPLALQEWQEILDTWLKILELLTSFDEEARRLRQSSPFCGILSEEERLVIFRKFRSQRAMKSKPKPGLKAVAWSPAAENQFLVRFAEMREMVRQISLQLNELELFFRAFDVLESKQRVQH